MGQEENQTAERQEQQDTPEKEVFGLSFKEVRSLVAKEHDVLLPENDALLMEVTILNAWLTEMEKVHKRHENALNRVMSERTNTYVAGVQDSVSSLTKELSTASIDGFKKVVQEQLSGLKSFQLNVFWAAAIVALSALVNVTVYILR